MSAPTIEENPLLYPGCSTIFSFPRDTPPPTFSTTAKKSVCPVCRLGSS